jgi:hypothetical protein
MRQYGLFRYYLLETGVNPGSRFTMSNAVLGFLLAKKSAPYRMVALIGLFMEACCLFVETLPRRGYRFVANS